MMLRFSRQQHKEEAQAFFDSPAEARCAKTTQMRKPAAASADAHRLERLVHQAAERAGFVAGEHTIFPVFGIGCVRSHTCASFC